MKQRRFVSVLAAGALCLSLLPTAAFAAQSMDNFKAEREYPAGQFTDVVAGSWYAGSVENAYELGLVEGTSKTTFSPTDPITVGSTLALACRLYSTYYDDNATFTGGSPWYQPYVDYAVAKGIITSGQFTDYNANATRRQFAAIQYAVNTVHKRGLRIDGGLERIFVAGAYPQQIRCLARSPAFSQKGGVTLSRQAVCPKHRIIFGLPNEEQRIHQHNILWIIQISKN